MFCQRCPEDLLWTGIVKISGFFKISKKRALGWEGRGWGDLQNFNFKAEANSNEVVVFSEVVDVFFINFSFIALLKKLSLNHGSVSQLNEKLNYQF